MVSVFVHCSSDIALVFRVYFVICIVSHIFCFCKIEFCTRMGGIVTIQYKLFNDLHCNECFAATCSCIVCCGVRFGLESRLKFCRHVTDLP